MTAAANPGVEAFALELLVHASQVLSASTNLADAALQALPLSVVGVNFAHILVS